MCRRRFGACKGRSGRVVTHKTVLGVPALPEATSVRHVEASALAVRRHILCYDPVAEGALRQQDWNFSQLRSCPAQALYRGARFPETGPGMAHVHASVPAPYRPSVSQTLPFSGHVSQPRHPRHALTKSQRDTTAITDMHLLPDPHPIPPPPSHFLPPRSFVSRPRCHIADRKSVHKETGGAQLCNGGWYLVRRAVHVVRKGPPSRAPLQPNPKCR